MYLYISYNLYKIIAGPNIFIGFIVHLGKEEKYPPKLALSNGRIPYAQSVNAENNKTINMLMKKNATLYMLITQITEARGLNGDNVNAK